MEKTLEDIEELLWDGSDEDILALAGEEAGFEYGENYFNVRFGNEFSRGWKPFYKPNCAKLLGNDFDFKDAAFARVVGCDVLNLTCTEFTTAFVCDRHIPARWNGLITVDGEVLDAEAEPHDASIIDASCYLYVPGKHDFQGKLVVFHLGKRTD